MSGGENSEIIQYFCAASCILCAVASLLVYGTDSNWRRRHYLHAQQSLCRCAAELCILLMYIVSEKVFQRGLVVIYLVLILTTVWGTFHSVLLGYVHIVLASPTLTNGESLVVKSWTQITAISCGLLYNVKYVLSLDTTDMETAAAVTLLVIETGNLTLLSRTFKEAIATCRANILLLFFVNILGIFCDFLLILYGGLCIYSLMIQELNDILLVVFTGTMLLQSVLVLYCGKQLDWARCAPPSEDEDIQL